MVIKRDYNKIGEDGEYDKYQGYHTEDLPVEKLNKAVLEGREFVPADLQFTAGPVPKLVLDALDTNTRIGDSILNEKRKELLAEVLADAKRYLAYGLVGAQVKIVADAIAPMLEGGSFNQVLRNPRADHIGTQADGISPLKTALAELADDEAQRELKRNGFDKLAENVVALKPAINVLATAQEAAQLNVALEAGKAAGQLSMPQRVALEEQRMGLLKKIEQARLTGVPSLAQLALPGKGGPGVS